MRQMPHSVRRIWYEMHHYSGFRSRQNALKLLIPDNRHGLTLALQEEVASRHDIDMWLAEGLSDALDYLNEHRADVIVIPPLARPERLSLTAIEQHVVLVETLLASCQRLDMMLVWCVGHQLFEQDHEHLLNESEQPHPSAAALQKLVELENSVRQHWHRHIVMRTSELFGSEGEGMVLPDQLSRWLAGEAVIADDHLFLAPLPVNALARAVLGVVLQLDNGADAWGTFHLSGREPVSQFEFAAATLACLRQIAAQAAIERISEQPLIAEGYESTVRRILGCQKILMAFGIHQTAWREPLSYYVRRWLALHDVPIIDDEDSVG